MSYPGNPQQLIIVDPTDPTGQAPVDKTEGLSVTPGPSMYELMLLQTKLLAAIWLTLSEAHDNLVDPDEALEGLIS